MYLLVTVAICLIGAALPKADAASCHLREIDLCLATVMLSATEGIPMTDEEIDKICEPVQEGIECMGNFTETCFTSLMKEMYSLAMVEPKKQIALMCTPGTEERAKYLKRAPCFQKTLTGENIKPIMEDFMNTLETAVENRFINRVPIMCCGIHRSLKDMMGLVERECGKDILEEEDMDGMSMKSASKMFCRGFEVNSPRCAGLLPPQGTPSKGSESKLQLIQMLNTAMSNLS